VCVSDRKVAKLSENKGQHSAFISLTGQLGDENVHLHQFFFTVVFSLWLWKCKSLEPG